MDLPRFGDRAHPTRTASACHTRVMTTRDEILDRYREYLEACNRQDWDAIGTYVTDSVLVNGSRRSRAEYVADIKRTIAIFPDYHWDFRRAVCEGEWLAVHLHDTGTREGDYLGAPGDGSPVETDDFNLYRIVDGLIVELEGTADNARLRQ